MNRKGLFLVILFLFVSLFFSVRVCFPVTCNVPTNNYPTIQSAIDDANCSTIEVAAGVYNEQLSINRALTLDGSGRATIIKPTSDKITRKYAREISGPENTVPIIAVTGGDVKINNIKVDGSLISDLSGLSGVDLFTGILYAVASGDIDSVIIEGIGILSGTGIYLYSNENYTVNVIGCKISDFLSRGVSANGNGLNVSIHNNTIIGRGYIDDNQQYGIEITSKAKGDVYDNYIANFSYADTDGRASCIFVYNAQGPQDGTIDVNIRHNILKDCQAGIVAWADNSNTYDIKINQNVFKENNLKTLKIPNVVGIYIATWSRDAVINAIIGGDDEIDGNDLTEGGPGSAVMLGDIPYHHPEGTVNATIKNNLISRFSYSWNNGIIVGLTSKVVNISNNFLVNNYTVDNQRPGAGINISSNVDVSNITVSYNAIAGNRPYGLYNAGDGILNAENNWWNSVDGPRPTGSGDLVSSNVDFEPYLNSSPTRLEKPNLLLSISAPSSASTGSTIKLTDKTINLGLGSSNTSTTRFYLSKDPILSSDDTNIGERSISGLAPGGKSKGTITSGTLSVSSGVYYIIAKADADNNNDEYNEHDNIAIREIKIGLPDLVVYKLYTPSSVEPGTTVNVEYKIKNRGVGDAPQSRLSFYASSDIVQGDDFYIGSVDIVPINKGETIVGNVNLFIPSNVVGYYLLAMIDSEEEIEEVNEDNNLGYRVMAIGPDLVVSSLSVPKSAYAGTTIVVTDTTKNMSTTSSTNSSSKTKFYLSDDTKIDEEDYVFANYHAVPILGPNGSDTKNTSLSLPSVSSGVYYICAKADADGEVLEYKENNNVRCKSITIK